LRQVRIIDKNNFIEHFPCSWFWYRGRLPSSSASVLSAPREKTAIAN
jgi:hypothetical protein